MKAIVFHEHGGPEVLRYEEVDRPHPHSGDVLVRVAATTLNRGLDVMTREGRFGRGLELPHVGGSDAAGEVVELGEDVDQVGLGDRVLVYPVLFCGSCDLCVGRGENYCRTRRAFGIDRWGGHADYVAVPQQNLVRLPDRLSYEAASTLSVSYITAWHGLVTRGELSADDTVLVMAAGSGIGTAAIQISRLAGARVLATTGSPWKQERARELGADAVFDYRDAGWPDRVLDATDGVGATILFDNVAGEAWNQSLRCLGRAGRLVCSGATAGHLVDIDLRRLYRDQVTFQFNAQGTKAELASLAGVAARGELEPVVDSRFALSDAAAAHARLATGQQFGKILLLPNS